MDHPGTRGCEKSESIDRSFSSPPEASRSRARSSALAPRSNTPGDTCRPGLSDRTIGQTLQYPSRTMDGCSAVLDTPLSNDNSHNNHCAQEPHAIRQTVVHHLY